MERKSFLTLEGEKLPVSSYQLEPDEEPWHGMCNKAEGYHLANLCLHIMANRPLQYLPAQINTRSGKEYPVWLIQKQSQVWSLDQDLASITQTLYPNTPKQAKIELGIQSYLVVSAPGQHLPVGSLLVKKTDRWGTGEGYGYRSLSHWESTIKYLFNRSRLPTFPENLVIFESLQWGLQYFRVNAWVKLFDAALKRAQDVAPEFPAVLR